MTTFRHRPGVTLVELMLFVSLMAVASGAILGFLFLTADARVRQSARADVQQVAVQLQQMLTHEFRAAEAVLLPARTATGTALALQVNAQDGSPLIFTVISGSLLAIRGSNTSVLTPSDITAANMLVTNLSATDDAPSLRFRLELQKRVPLLQVEYARETVELFVTPLPTHNPVGDDCGCTAPVCVSGNMQWETCLSGGCVAVENIPVSCP